MALTLTTKEKIREVGIEDAMVNQGAYEARRLSETLERVKSDPGHAGYLLNLFGNIRRTRAWGQKLKRSPLTDAELGQALSRRFGIDWGVEGPAFLKVVRHHTKVLNNWLEAHEADIYAIQDGNSLQRFDLASVRTLPENLQKELLVIVDAALADIY